MALPVFLVVFQIFTFVILPINGFSIQLGEYFNNFSLFDLTDIWKGVNVTDVVKALNTDHPHSTRQTTEVAELYGYVTETHEVIANGYILTLHRITGNSTHPKPLGKPAVLLMHGLLCSSMDWVMAGPQRGLAFLLADAGYDVWLGNFRGNKYSRKHETLGSSTKAYWSFSWHEQGVEDLPAMIDYILEKTENEKILYVGHSQGTTSFFVMASELPEYNDKIEAMFSLAPVAFCQNLYSPLLRFISMIGPQLHMMSDLFGQYEFASTNTIVQQLSQIVCNNNLIPAKLCSNSMFLFVGFNTDQLDMSLLPAILSHVPAGASMYQIYHYAQIIQSGRFRKFDHGFENMMKYFYITPPDYEIEKITTPIYLYYSNNDWLSNPKDVETLYSKLPNVRNITLISDDNFNHIDFLWAKDVKSLLYNELITTMSKYKKNIQNNILNNSKKY